MEVGGAKRWLEKEWKRQWITWWDHLASSGSESMYKSFSFSLTTKKIVIASLRHCFVKT